MSTKKFSKKVLTNATDCGIVKLPHKVANKRERKIIMAEKKIFCKDFELKWIWQRSRLENGPDGYYVVYHKPTGKCFYNRRFYNVRDARQYISWLVKATNRLLAERG